MHDLATLIGGIVGNAEFAAEMTSDPAGLIKALQAISYAANTAGKLLGQCVPLQRAIAAEFLDYDTSEMAERIKEGIGVAPGWRANVPAGLTGQIKVQPRWLAAAIWQLARETETSRGEIEFSTGPAVFPLVWHGSNTDNSRPLQLFHILLRYRADEMLVSKEAPVTPERPALLSAFELIRRSRGQIQTRPKPPGRQEISVLIPLL